MRQAGLFDLIIVENVVNKKTSNCENKLEQKRKDAIEDMLNGNDGVLIIKAADIEYEPNRSREIIQLAENTKSAQEFKEKLTTSGLIIVIERFGLDLLKCLYGECSKSDYCTKEVCNYTADYTYADCEKAGFCCNDACETLQYALNYTDDRLYEFISKLTSLIRGGIDCGGYDYTGRIGITELWKDKIIYENGDTIEYLIFLFKSGKINTEI